MTALLQLVIGGLTGLDGSGFSGLPLTGALARTFGTATGASIPVLACLGQISAIFIGGGTVVPWGLIPVAADVTWIRGAGEEKICFLCLLALHVPSWQHAGVDKR